MKILFFARLFYPHVGGVEKHVLEISKRLIQSRHSVTIVTEQFDIALKSKEEKDKITIFRIPVGLSGKSKKFIVWKWLYKNRHLLKNADIIHCHDVFFWYLPFALLNPMKNVYTTFHGYEGYPISKKAILYRKLFEYMSSKTICVGDFMRKWYHSKPTIVTYGAVSFPDKSMKPRKNTAIFIGRLDEQTGIETYVKAVKLIRKKIASFTLIVYGDGPYKDKMKRDGIILKGFDSSAEKEIGKYEFAFVSRYLAILEAMAAKRLVFAVYDNPVKEDYIKMSPFKDWIIICDTPETLARQVLYYKIHREEANKKIDKAFAWVKNQKWKNLTKTYLQLWESSITN